MNRILKRFIPWLIGSAFFVAAFNITEWLFERDDYKFKFTTSVIVPFISYFIFYIIMWVFGKFSRKQKKKD